MQAADSEFRRLLVDIQEGSEEAARKLVDRYGSALLRVIRRRLDPRLRTQFDSIDFLQEALATFLCEPPAPESFDSAEALFAFLANLARSKVISAQRQCEQKCDTRHALAPDGSTEVPTQEIGVSRPTPNQAAPVEEKSPAGATDDGPRPQNIISLLREGMSYREIALALGIQVKQVQRVVERIRAKTTEATP
jgi:RNA polymerase sigma factor (sigma-70 family)